MGKTFEYPIRFSAICSKSNHWNDHGLVNLPPPPTYIPQEKRPKLRAYYCIHWFPAIKWHVFPNGDSICHSLAFNEDAVCCRHIPFATHFGKSPGFKRFGVDWMCLYWHLPFTLPENNKIAPQTLGLVPMPGLLTGAALGFFWSVVNCFTVFSGWWQLKYLYFHPYFGRLPIWRAYVSDGLKPPTSFGSHIWSRPNCLAPDLGRKNAFFSQSITRLWKGSQATNNIRQSSFKTWKSTQCPGAVLGCPRKLVKG